MWLVIFSMFVIVNKSHKKTITNNVLVHLSKLASLFCFQKYPIHFFHIENSFYILKILKKKS